MALAISCTCPIGEAVASSSTASCDKLTKFEDMEVEFAIMTYKIKQALIDNNIDVHSLIVQLHAMCAVRDKKVPLFDENVFERISSVDEFWKSLSKFWSVCDYDLLRYVIKITKCEKAKRILEEFLLKIDPSALEDVDLVIHCRVDQREGSLMPTLRIKINAEKCTCVIQEKVKKIVSKKFNLEEYTLQFKGIKEGCIELLYHISEPVKSYLLELLQTLPYKITKSILLVLSAYKIIGLYIDDDDVISIWRRLMHEVVKGIIH